MSNQSDYEKNRKAALVAQKVTDNARAKAQKIKDAAKAVRMYGDVINQIQTQNIKPAKQEILMLETTIAIRQRQYNDEYRTRQPLDNTDLSILLNDPQFGSKGTEVYKKQMAGYQDRIKKAYQEIKNYEQKRNEQQTIVDGKKLNPPAKSSSKSSGTNPVTDQGKGIAFSKDYKYNAPMVRSAYFTSAKGVSESLVGVTNDGNFVDQGLYQDAMKAWTGTTGGRGTIQMDRKFTNALAKSQENQVTPLDPQMYGFKFLYNPKEVAMAWGVLDKMDPEYIASGTDPFNVISAGLMSATIQVTILLNRINDFAYINENGYNTGAGIVQYTDFVNQTGLVNPYPENVDATEVAEIYKKGTMYDIEYLLKTLNGPHATFVSKLNGKTADRGWLRPSIVELHLGAGMRYRVRVAQLAVTHTVFNSRMVPILSSVQLTLGRFNDGPETSGGGRYVGSQFVPNP
jgi:hypothetical protein